ncbi:helix-turn-helix domain-containing protein [Acidisoma cellulosilytica]|uniref:Helix-turn-helix domain-containing protein n=1 Tax=Acidisoma cellulosilyticum TaxID=2802395 RepID=A0A964E4C9_9PROT|nr:IclR family transcriptional regulator C-terminal domain-containing protein [Acidisoma cellulosilyticum]MCB8881162.1 helix-turn-helix domain-containing protein [Acidisoma cellulosilyticum]
MSSDLKAATPDRQKGIDRVIDLLEGLLRLRAPAKPGDLARLIGAPRSTTYEIVNRLVTAELLDYVGNDGRVYFGRSMQLFGAAFADVNTVYRRAVAAMTALAAETQVTAQVCALRGSKYVVLDSRSGAALHRITSDVGVEVPIPWTASGRLLLGHMTAEAIRAFVPDEDFRLPDGRLLNREDFIADVMTCTAQGWCETTGLADHFTRCFAAPIRDTDGLCRMTLCLVAPVDTAPDQHAIFLARLRAAAAQLSLQEPSFP